MSVPKNRYFLVSYYAHPNVTGNMWFPYTGGFPSNKWLKKEAEKHDTETITNTVILNIFEFKTKKDFENFAEK